MEHSSQFPLHRLSTSLLPTPFHKLEVLSDHLGVQIYCKRDDLTGFGFGGNKTRKLDFLLADALNGNATDIIAIGGKQSNFCRIAAAYAARFSLPCHLVLGSSRSSSNGNLILDELFGATISIVESDFWDDWNEQASKLSARLTATGRRPWLFPIGGSTPIGALGYVHAFLEMMQDFVKCDLRPTHIVQASSSGGTQAGLIVGKAITNWSGNILGIAVAKESMLLTEEITSLSNQIGKLLGKEIFDAQIIVDDFWIGEGYGIPTKEGIEAQQLCARMEGIVLDDVYTAKAAAALIAKCRNGEFTSNDIVVFLHTGGSPQIFSRTIG